MVLTHIDHHASYHSPLHPLTGIRRLSRTLIRSMSVHLSFAREYLWVVSKLTIYLALGNVTHIKIKGFG